MTYFPFSARSRPNVCCSLAAHCRLRVRRARAVQRHGRAPAHAPYAAGLRSRRQLHDALDAGGHPPDRRAVAYRRCRQELAAASADDAGHPAGFPADQLERVGVGHMAAGRPAREPAQLQGLGGDLLAHRRSACYTFDDRHVHARIGFYRRAGIPHRSARERRLDPGRPPVPRRRQRQGVRHRADDQQRRMVEPRGSRTATTSASTTPRRRSTARRQAAPTSRRRRRSSRAPTATSTPTPRTSGSAASTITRRCCNRTATTTSPASRTPTSFRDPFVFTDPAHPGKTYMVFEGNTAARAVHAPAPTRISATRRTIRTRKISTR